MYSLEPLRARWPVVIRQQRRSVPRVSLPGSAVDAPPTAEYIAYVATSASGAAPKIARIDTEAATESVSDPPDFTSADSIDISDDGKFVAIGGQDAPASA